MAAARIRTWRPEDSNPPAAKKPAAAAAPAPTKKPAEPAPAAQAAEPAPKAEKAQEKPAKKKTPQLSLEERRQIFIDITKWAREKNIWTDPNPYVVFVNYCVDEKPEWLNVILTDQWLRPVLSRYFNPNADLGPEYRV